MAKKHKTHIVKVEEDPETGCIIIPIPKDILNTLKWQANDELTVLVSGNVATVENMSAYLRSHWKCLMGNNNCKTPCGDYGCHN